MLFVALRIGGQAHKAKRSDPAHSSKRIPARHRTRAEFNPRHAQLHFHRRTPVRASPTHVCRRRLDVAEALCRGLRVRFAVKTPKAQQSTARVRPSAA
eukprot:scaffold327_cov257-Pinguiococcus_pyrenoidosus.AAC.12